MGSAEFEIRVERGFSKVPSEVLFVMPRFLRWLPPLFTPVVLPSMTWHHSETIQLFVL